MIWKSSGTLAVLLSPDLDIALQLNWAICLAKILTLDLLLLLRLQNQDERVVEVSLTQGSGNEDREVVSEVRRIVAESPTLYASSRDKGEKDIIENREVYRIHVRLKIIYHTSHKSLRRTLLTELGDKNVEYVTQARKQHLDLVRERRFFFRYLPCKAVLCQGLEKENKLARILIATEPGPNGKSSLQFGLQLAASRGVTPTVLHINPDVGMDAKQVGERRLERLLKKTLGPDQPVVNRRVAVNDKVPQGIRG